MRSRSGGQSGVTLVELLIALALLAFVLLGIVPLFLGSVKSNYAANEYTSIHILARDRLEQLMNRPFLDPLLAPGVYANDLPATLPNPLNPTALSTVFNPFQITYQVSQYQVPAPGAVGNGAPFTPTRITAAGQPYQYKRIDVTILSRPTGVGTNIGFFGIGARVVRLSGIISNPSPANAPADCGLPGVNCSLADGCALGAPAPCP